jgi:hypothetical protein
VAAVRRKQAAARTLAPVGAAPPASSSSSPAAAYVDHKDMAGWTPLHLAAQQGHSHTLQTLLEEGANHAAVNQVRRQHDATHTAKTGVGRVPKNERVSSSPPEIPSSPIRIKQITCPHRLEVSPTLMRRLGG